MSKAGISKTDLHKQLHALRTEACYARQTIAFLEVQRGALRQALDACQGQIDTLQATFDRCAAEVTKLEKSIDTRCPECHGKGWCYYTNTEDEEVTEDSSAGNDETCHRCGGRGKIGTYP